MTVTKAEQELRLRKARTRRIEAALRALLTAIDEDGGHNYEDLRDCPVCRAIRSARLALGDIPE